jgi:addiction module RelB/DinJ family antitoxin
MSKAGTITVCVHPKLLKSASRILREVGLNTPDAVTLFLKQVVRQGGLPFDERAPKVKARRPEREVGNPKWRPRAKKRPPEEDALAPFLERCRKGAEEGRRKWKEALGEG